tara:strand:+ start:111 stop:998 length:888 start_codon:yes stop_codon:yes gene_type:complete
LKFYLSYFGLFLLSAIWGSSFIFIKLSVDSIHPVLLTSYRLIIAFAILLFFCNLIKIRKLLKNNKKDLIIIALFGNVLPFNLISWSQLYVDSLIASTLIGTMPLFTLLISFNFFKEKFKIQTINGLVLGFLGMIIFLKPNHESVPDSNLFYPLLIIFSSILYAFSANWVKTVKENASFELACSSIGVAAFFSIPLSIFLFFIGDNQISVLVSNITLKSFISASFLGVLCTGLAISIFFKLIESKSAVFASQSNYLIPCFGFLWSYIFLEEVFTLNLITGFLLIVIGGFLVNRQLK